MINELVVVW